MAVAAYSFIYFAIDGTHKRFSQSSIKIYTKSNIFFTCFHIIHQNSDGDNSVMKVAAAKNNLPVSSSNNSTWGYSTCCIFTSVVYL